MINSKLKNPNSTPDMNNTMEAFQDGSQHNNVNIDRQNEYLNNVDNTHSSHDSQSYGNQGIGMETFGKGHDNVSNQQMPAYNRNMNANTANMGGNDRQQGHGTDFSQQSNQYNQYNMGGMRPAYPQNRQPGMNMNRPNNGPQGQFPNPSRMGMMPGHQQSGPTPTLNQLLTNANAGQRYSSNTYGHGDYGKTPDMNAQPYNNQMWGNQQRPFVQHPGHAPYRNQVCI